MDKFFSFLWQPRIFVRMCIAGVVCIVIADLLYSVTFLAIGFGLMALAAITFIWEDSKQYPEIL